MLYRRICYISVNIILNGFYCIKLEQYTIMTMTQGNWYIVLFHSSILSHIMANRRKEHFFNTILKVFIVNFSCNLIPVYHCMSSKKGILYFVVGSNTCFYGKCYYCKGEETGVCGEEDILEGTVILWLPRAYPLKTHRHPWARTYVTGKLAQ